MYESTTQTLPKHDPKIAINKSSLMEWTVNQFPTKFGREDH